MWPAERWRPDGSSWACRAGAILLCLLLAVPAPVLGAPVAGGAGTPAPGDSLATQDGSAPGTPAPLVGDAPPTDPDGDGVYEDVNGDGRVTVSDAQALLAGLANASAPTYDLTRDGNVTRADAERLFAVTAGGAHDEDVDVDGLPGGFEREATGTDPELADSDAPTTERNESGNGVPDGAEDFDGDGVVARREALAGTDPLSNDTDGDGVGDAYESAGARTRPGLNATLRLSPTDTDTDGNGTPDGAADPDGDGVGVATELAAGTEVLAADTDGDGLDDGTEVRGPTDPLVNDTDGDGLDDAAEARLGTNATVADTDGDGTPDGAERYRSTVTDAETGARVTFNGTGDVAGGTRERYRSTVTDAETGARVTFNGTGDVAGGTRVSAATRGVFGTAYVAETTVGTPVRVEPSGAFENATVTLPYTDGAVANESRLAVARYDETRQRFVRLESTVDPAANTVTARVDSFSVVALREAGGANRTVPALSPRERADAPDLSYGETVHGHVYTANDSSAARFDGHYENVSFEGEAGDVVTVDLVEEANEDDDPAFVLVGPGGSVINRTEDDGGGRGTVRATNLTLPRSGEYTVVVHSENRNPPFHFFLTVGRQGSGSPVGPTLPDVDPSSVEYGGTVRGLVNATTDERADRYGGYYDEVTFEAAAGDAATIELAEGANDDDVPAFTVLGPDGSVVAEQNGDGGDVGYVTAENVSLLEGGEYTVVVRSQRRNPDYGYFLTVRKTALDSDGDGLTDSREKAGLPISPSLAASFEESDEREDANLTVVGDADAPNGVETDPFDADTDGDGTPDGREVGRFVERRALFGTEKGGYYTLNGDPTDPNTDGVGLNDTAERATGSDPLTEESLTVWYTLPTRSESGTEPQPVTTDRGGATAYVLRPTSVHTPRLQSSRATPEWLDDAYAANDGANPPDAGTFLLVDVPVYRVSEGGDGTDEPVAASFDMPNGAVVAQGIRRANDDYGEDGDGDWYEDTDSVPLYGDVTVVSLVIAIPETPDLDTTSGKTATEMARSWQDDAETDQSVSHRLGRVTMTVTAPSGSIFLRDRDGGRRISVTTHRPYAVRYFGQSDAVRIYENSMDKVRSTAINALTTQIGTAVGGAGELGVKYGMLVGSRSIKYGGLLVSGGNVIRGTTDYTIASYVEKEDREGPKRTDLAGGFGAVEGTTRSATFRNFVVDEASTRQVTIGKQTIGFFITHTGAVVVRYN